MWTCQIRSLDHSYQAMWQRLAEISDRSLALQKACFLAQDREPAPAGDMGENCWRRHPPSHQLETNDVGVAQNCGPILGPCNENKDTATSCDICDATFEALTSAKDSPRRRFQSESGSLLAPVVHSLFDLVERLIHNYGFAHQAIVSRLVGSQVTFSEGHMTSWERELSRFVYKFDVLHTGMLVGS